MIIKAVIFDFDGVIVDSESRWPTVENPYIRKHTVGWRDSAYDNLIGMGLDEVYHHLVSRYAFDVSKEQYFADYEELALSLYSSAVMPVRGIVNLLDSLQSKGIHMSIASSSKPTWIRAALEKHGMNAYFESITSSHDSEVAHGKPAPDVYLAALVKHNLLADMVIAIEDSRNGIAAAMSAGIYCIGVNIDGVNTQDISRADMKITQYNELLSLFT